MAEAEKGKFQAAWEASPGFPNLFRFKKASYWKGSKGWWASRGEGDEIHGPFRGPRIAQAWAEEPYRLEWETQAGLRQAKRDAKDQAAQERIEARALATWGSLPPGQRTLCQGQIWVRRGESFGNQQLLIMEVRKATAIVKTRNDTTAWAKAPTDIREIKEVLRLYRFLGRSTGKRV